MRSFPFDVILVLILFNSVMVNSLCFLYKIDFLGIKMIFHSEAFWTNVRSLLLILVQKTILFLLKNWIIVIIYCTILPNQNIVLCLVFHFFFIPIRFLICEARKYSWGSRFSLNFLLSYYITNILHLLSDLNVGIGAI